MTAYLLIEQSPVVFEFLEDSVSDVSKATAKAIAKGVVIQSAGNDGFSVIINFRRVVVAEVDDTFEQVSSELFSTRPVWSTTAAAFFSGSTPPV